MRDANIVTLYKHKGDRSDCNNYRGISLLSVVGNVFARVALTRLQILAERTLAESQEEEHYREVHEQEDEGRDLEERQVAERESGVRQRALDKENGRSGEVGPRLTEGEQGGINMDEEL